MRNTSKTNIVGIVLLAGICFVLYGNFELRKQNESLIGSEKNLNVKDHELEELRNYGLIERELEGQLLPGPLLSMQTEKGNQFRELVQRFPASFLLAAPPGSCTPCFSMALDRFIELDDSDSPPVFVVSQRSRAGSRAVYFSIRSNLKDLIVDSTGILQRELDLPETYTIAVLVDNTSRIIYCGVVDSKYPQDFDRFLSRAIRFAKVNK